MWSLRHRYTLQMFGSVVAATTLATVGEARPFRPGVPVATPAGLSGSTFNINVNTARNNRPNNQPFFFRSYNPWQSEAAREQSILFNRSFSLNQPLSPMGLALSRQPSWYTPGTNPFMPVFPGGPTVQQAAYNTSVLGSALQSVPPWAFGAGNPLLYGGGYPAYPSAGGYGGGSALYSSPYGSGSTSPYGGYMSGSTGTAGDVGGGNTNTLSTYGDPALTREAARQAHLDTRRRAFEEYLFERLNAPTHEDMRQFGQHEALRRSLNEPPSTEVFSGQALNTLLNDVQKLQGMNRDAGPDVALDDDMVKRLNVTATNGRGGNMGFLKDGGRLSWPLGLRSLPPADEMRDLRSQTDTLLQDAVSQAANGKVDSALVQELTRNVDRMRKLLLARANDVPENTYIDAKQFLNNLDDSVRLLQRPDAGDYVNGRYAAKGASVEKLVKYMADHGLQFAPAVPGDEAAYGAVYRALARYDSAMRMNELRRTNDTTTARTPTPAPPTTPAPAPRAKQ